MSTCAELYARCLPVGEQPHPFQERAADRLAAGQNVLLRAPTGTGKTLAALVPFLHGYAEGRYSRLLYCLPLRALVRSIHREASRVAADVAPGLTVTMQTGETADDEFFATGQIVVCTYDQLLSGLLAAPYGLSPRLFNINAAAATGALVVFDELHLMEPSRAFLTAVALMARSGGLTQSLWMSATATSPLQEQLEEALQVECIAVGEDERAKLPAVARVERTIQWHPAPLTATALLEHRNQRVIALCNRVDRARALFEEATAAAPQWPARLLHSRFFPQDRDDSERWVVEHFGREERGPALLVTTQVIEAGMDLTSDVLHTELAPMNALVQRAGRCARFAPAGGGTARGTVVVHALAGEGPVHLPYQAEECIAARAVLEDEAAAPVALDPERAARWVERCHAELDRNSLQEGFRRRRTETAQILLGQLRGTVGVSELIRRSDDTVRVVLAAAPPESPAERETVQLSRWSLQRQVEAGTVTGWAYAPREKELAWQPLDPAALRLSYYVCLPPAVAEYTSRLGLVPGRPGVCESPPRTPRARPGYAPLGMEPWAEHAANVRREALRRAELELPPAGPAARALHQRYAIPYKAYLRAVELCALLHDLGKLQHRWQAFAQAYQVARCEPAGVPLAHTRYDRACQGDRDLQARVEEQAGRRGPHAAQGAYLALAACGAFAATGGTAAGELLAASLAAILSHHGGWLPEEQDLACDRLWPGWEAVVPFLEGHGVPSDSWSTVAAHARKRETLCDVVEAVVGSESIDEYWPLAALLMRVLRLSDQKATAEGAGE